MATTINDYIEKAKLVQSKINSEIITIVNSNKDDILDLNREDQIFDSGIGINGSILGTYKKTRKNGATRGYPKNAGTPFNFFATGALFSNFNLISDGKKLTITNKDKKVGLLSKYGEFIGLTEENKNKLNYEIIYPELMKFIKTYL